MEDARVRRQNGAEKLRGLMLDALMTKKLSEVAKCHLDNVVAKQLEEIVKKKCLELILSKQMEDVIFNILKVLNIRALVDEPSPSPPPPPPPPPPTLLLQFRSEEIPMLFAGTKLGDQLMSPLEVVLVDASGKVISEGKEASASLKLVVLDADAGERGEAMTWEEFQKAELPPRKSKCPLLTGKLDVKLEKGEGIVDPSVCFTDNSRWVTRRSFCLGLIPATSESRIVGTKTRPFIVRDRKSKDNKKCEKPKSSDKIWVLRKIRKDGIYHSRLLERGIHSVGDFTAYLESNREEIKLLFKPHDFKITEAHARKCETNREDESLHGTHKNDDSSSYNNGEALITCLPNHGIDQSGEQLKAPDQAQPEFHGQDRASNAEMYTATQQCVGQAEVPNQTISLEGPDFEDSNVIITDGQVDGNANPESNNRFGQATPGQIRELRGNPLARSIKRPWGQISKQRRISNQATSSHEVHRTTFFSPSEILDSNVLAKDLLMVSNPKRIVFSESHNATIGCPSKNVSHWNESNTHLSTNLDPMTLNMFMEHNVQEFQDGIYPIPMVPFPSYPHTSMDLDSNPLTPDSVHNFNHGNTVGIDLPSNLEDLETWIQNIDRC